MFLVGLTGSLAQTKANLSGKWVMDQTQSQGMPPDMDQILTITHTGDQLKVQAKIYPPNTPNVIRDDTYNIDGKPSPYSQILGNGDEAKGTRTAQWTDDGRGIAVSEELSSQSARGPVSIKRSFKWSLSSDGRTLTIELDQTAPQPAKNKRVFVKK